MKIGLFGGTFNPLHNGHIQIAKEAFNALRLDKVWLIPNKTPPNKKKAKLISSEHKYNICKLAADKYNFLEVCDFELKSNGVNWTYMTVEGLHELYPEHEFYFIMGADTLLKFTRWNSAERICKVVKVIVLNRSGFEINKVKEKIAELKEKYNAEIYLIESNTVDVSSTEIRAGLKHEMLLPEIKDYIHKNNLY